MTAQLHTLVLSDGLAEVEIAPGLGAGLARYDLISHGRREPLLRPCRDLSRASPFDLANILLVPWSNRISGGGFAFGGRFHPLHPNLAGEPMPIHGSGFSAAWETIDASAGSALLALDSDGPRPFKFAAAVRYALEEGALQVAVEVTNRGPEALPFGLGLHPWFPRTPGTTLQARAAVATLEDRLHLPAGQIDVASREDWNFATHRALPHRWINNDFSPWDGQAEIVWRDRGLRLRIEAEDPLAAYILYSPGSDADFFCFEPVTHLVDAHNRAGGPEESGLAILNPGDALTIACRFTPSQL